MRGTSMGTTSARRIAVVGAGRIGFLHARNIVHQMSALELAGVVEPRPSAEVRAWADECSVRIWRDAQEMFAAPGIHAVLISTPTDTHAALIGTAAAAGLHIFCEKPVTPDVESALAAVRRAADAGVLLQIGFNRRFDHNFAALRNAAVAGRLGRIEIVRVTSRDPGPPPLEYVRRSGGLFMDMTIHDFDMIRFLSGAEVTEVYARGASLVDPAIGEAGDIDTAVVSLQLSDGSLGIIENSRRASYGYDQRAEIHGSAGAATTANDTGSTLVVSDHDGVCSEKPLYFFLERYSRSFVSELESFAESMDTGAPPAVSGRDGVEAMRVAAACARSLREGAPVKLESSTAADYGS